MILLTGLVAPICMMLNTWYIQEQAIIDYSIEWIDSRENLIYAKWADLWVHGVNKNRTDCSGIYAWLGMDLGLRGKDLWKHLNSFKFFELWERYRDINKMKEWDIIFFESSNWYHIATVTKPYENRKVEIIDWIRTKTTRSPEKRYIKIIYYWGYRHYNINAEKRYRLMFATNMFVEEFKRQNKIFTWTTNLINENKKLLEDYSRDYISYMFYYSIMYSISDAKRWIEMQWMI